MIIADIPQNTENLKRDLKAFNDALVGNTTGAPGDAPKSKIGSGVELTSDDGRTGNDMDANNSTATNPEDNIEMDADALFALKGTASGKRASGNNSKPETQGNTDVKRTVNNVSTPKKIIDGMEIGGKIVEAVQQNVQAVEVLTINIKVYTDPVTVDSTKTTKILVGTPETVKR